MVSFQTASHYGSTVFSIPHRQRPRMEHFAAKATYEEAVIQIAVRVRLKSFPLAPDCANGIETKVSFYGNH